MFRIRAPQGPWIRKRIVNWDPERQNNPQRRKKRKISSVLTFLFGGPKASPVVGSYLQFLTEQIELFSFFGHKKHNLFEGSGFCKSLDPNSNIIDPQLKTLQTFIIKSPRYKRSHMCLQLALSVSSSQILSPWIGNICSWHQHSVCRTSLCSLADRCDNPQSTLFPPVKDYELGYSNLL